MSTETPPRDHPRAASIESGTGTALETWVQRISEAGGQDLDHAAIARLLPERWDATAGWARSATWRRPLTDFLSAPDDLLKETR